MRILKRGSAGPEVGLLRRLLNRKQVPSPHLPEANLFGARYNGAVHSVDFGPQMDAAVRTFQQSRRLAVDGMVGPQTWRALGLTLDTSKAVTLVSQPDNNTCYAAAATMVLGPSASMSVDAGPAPPGVALDDHWARSFSQRYGWQIEFGTTPMPNRLAMFINSGPFWIAGNLPFPTGPSYHAVVVGAIWGDGDADRTMLLIYDPWPVNIGEAYGIILGDYVRSFPQAFRYILHR